MAEKFLEPNVPLKKIDKETGDTLYIYPQTTASQIKVDSGERLNAVLDKVLYHGNDDEDIVVDDTGYVEVNLDGAAESDVVIPVNADTLGGHHPGKYRTAYNLFDNSYFRIPVNQRRLSSMVGSSITYFIDRWLTYGTGATFTSDSGKVTISNDGSATCGFLQRIDSSKLDVGKKYTLAFKASVVGTKWYLSYGTNATNNAASSSALEEGSNKIHIFTFELPESLTNVYNFRIRSSAEAGSAEVEWAALYEGEYTAETLPEYMPKGYAHELAECQRYYQRVSAISSYGTFGVAMVYKADTAYAFIPYTTMRSAPEVNSSGILEIQFPSLGAFTVNSITLDQYSSGYVRLYTGLPSNSIPLGTFGNFRAKNDKTAYIEFSADL